MKKKLISILLMAVMLSSLFVLPASAAKTVGAKTTTALNLRKSAGTSAAILMTMPKNAQVIVLSGSNGWSKVVYKNTIGYASKQYLKAATTVSGKFGTGTVSGSDVNMRKGAGTSYKILTTLAKGTKLTVTGANGNWYAVSYKDKTGYVSADYVKISASTSSTTYPGVIVGTSVRMRSGAGTSYKILGTYNNGTKMTVSGATNGWYKVKCDGKSGYVSGKYMHITPKTAYDKAKSGEITGSSVCLRMGPSSSFSTVSTLSKGTELKISGIYGSWYEVTAKGSYGYVSKSYVALHESSDIPEPAEKLDAAGTVNGDDVRLRSGPGTDYKIIAYYNNGTKVKIFGKTDDWYAVNIDGKEGYMSKDYIKLTTNSGKAAKIIEMAKSYLDVPYVYGGSSPSGFDCSGLVYYVYGQNGIQLERGAGSQYNKNGYEISKSELKPGDLVFFSDSVDKIGHVAIYIGDGDFIHASSGKGCVTINNLEDYYYKEHYSASKRVL